MLRSPLGAIAGSSSAVALIAFACAVTPATGAEEPSKRAFDLQGHRGGRGLWPENTLAGFAGALSLGVSTLELDCAVTRDGVVVVSHDSALNPDHTRDASGRFLDKPGPAILSLSYEELRRYDVGRLKPGTAYAALYPDQQPRDGERIPRLADVFALVARSGNTELRFNIETKLYPDKPELTVGPEEFAQAVVRVVAEAGMQRRSTIQSFDWRTLALVRKLAPEIATVALTSQRPGSDTLQAGRPGASPWLAGLDVDDFGGSIPKLVKAGGAAVWSPNYLDLEARQLEEAHALGLPVVPWTINEPPDMERILGWGVDGIITDRPDRLRSVLEAKGMPLPRPTPVRP